MNFASARLLAHVVVSFALLVAAGCASISHEPGAGPGADPGAGLAPATSLDGTITCGSTSCAPGELCVHYVPGHDAGVASVPRCEPAPADCTTFYDCDAYGETSCCAPAHRCARVVCDLPDDERCEGWGLARVRGRDVTCARI